MTTNVLRNCDSHSGFEATLANYMWLNWVVLILASLYLVTILKGITRGFRLYVGRSERGLLCLFSSLHHVSDSLID